MEKHSLIKTLFPLFLASTLCGFSHAETYKVNFTAPSNVPGKMWNYGFVVDLQFADNGAITGEMKEFFGTKACSWPGMKITGGNLSDGTFRWMTDEHPVKSCGKIVFVGKKEDNKLVGYLPKFQGVKLDLTLEPAP